MRWNGFAHLMGFEVLGENPLTYEHVKFWHDIATFWKDDAKKLIPARLLNSKARKRSAEKDTPPVRFVVDSAGVIFSFFILLFLFYFGFLLRYFFYIFYFSF